MLSGRTPSNGRPRPRSGWDFFVSYDERDRRWAEWIAWHLEAAEHRVLLQAWDFVPGTHWTAGLQEGVTRSDRLIAVLSSSFLESAANQGAWQATYKSDPIGIARRLVVVRVAECEVPGLLGNVVPIDLVGIREDAALSRLLDGIEAAITGRAKPADQPRFPGRMPSHAELGWPTSLRPPTPPPVYPGSQPRAAAAVSSLGRVYPRRSALHRRWSTPLDDTDPDAVDVYRLICRLRVTAGSTVFLGEGPGRQLAAVKMMHPHLASQPAFRERFRAEVERARSVVSVHSAMLLGAGTEDARPWSATEFIDGPTLDEVVEEDGAMSELDIRQLAVNLLGALREIHSTGMVHRDLSPSNIVLSIAGPRIIDLRSMCESGYRPPPGERYGTPRCMAPEQWLDEELTAATDVFAWGVVVVRAATARWPFPGQTRDELRQAVVLAREPALHDLAPPLRTALRGVFARAATSRPSLDELGERFSRPGDHAGGDGHGAVRAGTSRRLVLASGGLLGAAAVAAFVVNAGDRPYGTQEASTAFDQANQVAAVANQHRPDDPSLARALDLAAFRLEATDLTRRNLLRHAHLRTFSDHDGGVTGVAFLPAAGSAKRGELVSVGRDGRLCIRQSDGSGDPHMVLAADVPLKGIAASPAGRLVATVGDHGAAALRDIPGGLLRRPLVGHTANVDTVAFSAKGELLATGAADGTIRLWNLLDPESPPRILQHGLGPSCWVHGVAFSSDDRTLVSVGDSHAGNPVISLWKFRESHLRPTVITGHFNFTGSVAFGPGGERFVVVSQEGTVRLFRTAALHRFVELVTPTSKDVKTVAFHPKGGLFATGDLSANVILWDVEDEDGDPVVLGEEDSHTGGVRALSFSADGRICASASDDQTVRLWNTEAPDIADRLCQEDSTSVDDRLWNQLFPAIPHPGPCR